jgi:protein-tyrosine phosphatase
MIDLHSHILPDLDDGARDWGQALAMARMAAEDGVRTIVCTPHWEVGRFENMRSQILSVFEEFQKKVEEERIPLTLHPGSELRLDVSLSERIRAGEVLTLNDQGRYILLELSGENLPQNLEDFIFRFQLAGITPVISHVERIKAFRENIGRLHRLVQSGVLAQLTAFSLLGQAGEEIRKFSLFLLEHRLVHVLATDAHGLRTRSPRLSEGHEIVKEVLGEKKALEMVQGVPDRIIRGEPVEADDPVPVSRPASRSFWKRLFDQG